MTAAAEIRDSSILPPPEPRDEKGTRPPVDLAQVARQVWGVQWFLRGERERREQTREKEKGAGE